ncbi:MAG: hypothetical protein V7771_01085 [Shewanella psychromarinicola]|uniref:hypothetical protein n=1 Tax=Shewanella psychromarinicola TaxID=2487742 RepID=UPI003001BBE1
MIKLYKVIATQIERGYVDTSKNGWLCICAIMGLNNFYSSKRLRKELKHLAEEAERERTSRKREEDLKNKLSSLETVFITMQEMRSYCYNYRLHMFGVIFEKVNIEDGLSLMDEALNQLKLAEGNMQVIANVYLEDTPARTAEIIEYISVLNELNYRAGRLLRDENVEEARLVFKNKMKTQIIEFRDYLSELEIELCEYITNVRKNS